MGEVCTDTLYGMRIKEKKGVVQWSKLFKPASTTSFFSGEAWPLAKVGNSSLSPSRPSVTEIWGGTSRALACSAPELEPGSLRFMDDVPARCLHVFQQRVPQCLFAKSEGSVPNGSSVGRRGTRGSVWCCRWDSILIMISIRAFSVSESALASLGKLERYGTVSFEGMRLAHWNSIQRSMFCCPETTAPAGHARVGRK